MDIFCYLRLSLVYCHVFLAALWLPVGKKLTCWPGSAVAWW